MHDIIAAPQVEDEDVTSTENKDSWFDQWMIAKGQPLKQLISSMLGGLAAHEWAGKTRQRKRKTEDQLRYAACVEVLACNLAYEVLKPSQSGRIAIRRGKRFQPTRYDNRILSPKVLVPILDRIAEIGWITQQTGSSPTGLSTIAPTDWFARRTLERGVSFADFGRSEYEELVVLTQKWKFATETGLKKIKANIDYPDCSEADEIRNEVRLLNRFLESSDLAFIDDEQEPRVDPYQRTLKRRFNLLSDQSIRFNQGGRLFSSWWMNLKKTRRVNIRIQGEPPAELDFSNMFARLAYARLEREPPEGDLYDLSGHLDGYKPEHRKGVKEVFNALLFGGGARFPEGLGKDLPAGSTMPKVRKAIASRHPDLAHLFGTMIGFDLMYIESLILIEVLRRLNAIGIVGLGLHDAVMVPNSQATTAKDIMEASSKQVAGMAIPVKIKPLREISP